MTAYDRDELWPAGYTVNQHPGGAGLPAYAAAPLPGSFVSILIGDSTHSLIFTTWVLPDRGQPITKYAAISGNNKGMVWSHDPLSLPTAQQFEGRPRLDPLAGNHIGSAAALFGRAAVSRRRIRRHRWRCACAGRVVEVEDIVGPAAAR